MEYSISTAVRRRSGFTLLETVFAMLILAIAMLASFGVMSYSLKTIHSTRQQLYVSRVLETTMETVRNLSWDELTSQPATQTFDATNPVVPLFGKTVNDAVVTGGDFGGAPYRPQGRIFIDPVAGLGDLRRITVQVDYRAVSRRNAQSAATLVTFKSRNGVDRR